MTKKFWEIRAAGGKSAELNLYGPISSKSWYGDEVTPKQLTSDLKALGDISSITVRINSGGGDVFAGIAIYNILKSHKAKVATRVEGLAASAASIIAMAGDEILMPTGSMMMVHNPSTYAGGQAKDFREVANMLDKVRENLIDIYVEKTGLSRSTIGKQLDDETWLSADEAVTHGYATKTLNEQIAASIYNNTASFNGQVFDLSMYKRKPGVASASYQATSSYQKPGDSRVAADFEAIRTTENSHIIDAAIRDGKTVGEASIEIIKAGLLPLGHSGQVVDDEVDQEAVDAIVGYINDYRAQTDPYYAAKLSHEQKNMGPTSTGDPDVDAIIAEVYKIRNGR